MPASSKVSKVAGLGEVQKVLSAFSKGYIAKFLEGIQTHEKFVIHRWAVTDCLQDQWAPQVGAEGLFYGIITNNNFPWQGTVRIRMGCSSSRGRCPILGSFSCACPALAGALIPRSQQPSASGMALAAMQPCKSPASFFPATPLCWQVGRFLLPRQGLTVPHQKCRAAQAALFNDSGQSQGCPICLRKVGSQCGRNSGRTITLTQKYEPIPGDTCDLMW